MKTVRKHIIFSGRVQGVGFRYHAFSIAQALSLTGYVKNRSDGTVEMEVQGTEERIGTLLACLKAEKYIDIREMNVEERSLRKEKEFLIS